MFDPPLSYLIFSPVLTSHQALVEKDWLAFGHPFSDRIGMPNVAGSGSFELPIQSSSARSFPSSPVRQTSGSTATQSPGSSHGLNNYSPIFLQVSSSYVQVNYSFFFGVADLITILEYAHVYIGMYAVG